MFSDLERSLQGSTHRDGRGRGEDELGAPAAGEDALAELSAGLVNTKPFKLLAAAARGAGGGSRRGRRDGRSRGNLSRGGPEGGRALAGNALAVPLVVVLAVVARDAGSRALPANTAALLPGSALSGNASGENASEDIRFHLGDPSKLNFDRSAIMSLI